MATRGAKERLSKVDTDGRYLLQICRLPACDV